jgi:hypothetical protein
VTVYAVAVAFSGVALLTSVVVLLAFPNSRTIDRFVTVSFVGAGVVAVSTVLGVARRRRFVAESSSKALELAAEYAASKGGAAPVTPEGRQALGSDEARAEEHLQLAERALRRTGAEGDALAIHDARLLGSEGVVVGSEVGVGSSHSQLRIQRARAQPTDAEVAAAREALSQTGPPSQPQPDTHRSLWSRLRPLVSAPVLGTLAGVIATLLGAGASWAEVIQKQPTTNVFAPRFAPVFSPTNPNVVQFSPTIESALVNDLARADCVGYLVELDELVDDEPDIAKHLPGGSFPVDSGARACGLKSSAVVDAVAAYLARR